MPIPSTYSGELCQSVHRGNDVRHTRPCPLDVYSHRNSLTYESRDGTLFGVSPSFATLLLFYVKHHAILDSVI